MAGSIEINSGMAENEYGILCQGNTLTLTINGKEVRSLVDSKYLLPEGKVGISVSSFRDVPVIADLGEDQPAAIGNAKFLCRELR